MNEVGEALISEEKAVAIMLANLKQPKNTDLLQFAQACRYLINKWGIHEMSRYFKTSQYMLRQIDKINELSPDLQKLVKEGKLKIESSYQLWRLPEPKRKEAAKIIQKMPSSEVRHFMYYLHKNRHDLDKALTLFKKNKPEKIRMLVLPLTDEFFEKLESAAKSSRSNIHDFSLKILEDHIYGKKK